MAFAERPASNKIFVPPQPANMQFPDDPDEREHVDIVETVDRVETCEISAILIFFNSLCFLFYRAGLTYFKITFR